jgi:trk system potassium uptake protein TrkH
MFYSVLWELRRPLLPKKAVVENYVWYGTGKVFMNDTRIREAADYVLLYLVTLALGTAIIAAYGHEVGKALFEYASAQGTVGLSVGITQPNAPLPVLWTLIAGMFLGRLEFYVIFRSVAKIALDGRRMLFARG